jgi:hypothetical protein
VAILHEFWIQYNPSQHRIHAFFEGHDDVAFFSHFIDRFVPPESRVYVYRCEGKARVYEAFVQITGRLPTIRSVLFFVDKDLDDVLGTAWPTDPRIFVTDTYSVENYLVSLAVLQRLYRDAVRVTNVTFDEDLLATHFERELQKFHKRISTLMAWVLVSRRLGDKPNLSNIDLSQIFAMTQDCELRAKCRARLELMCRATGVAQRPNIGRQILPVARELSRLAPKRFVRGKFEAWFFVAFWKSLLRQLNDLTREGGGKMSIKIALERDSFCATLKAYADIPRSLELFLSAHLTETAPLSPQRTEKSTRAGWLSKLRALIRRNPFR